MEMNPMTTAVGNDDPGADDTATNPPDYRRGDYVGTPAGQLAFDGVTDDGYQHVHSRTTSYRVPTHLRGRDEIREWAIRSVLNGDIGSALYVPQKQQPSAEQLAATARAKGLPRSNASAVFSSAQQVLNDGPVWKSGLTTLAEDVGTLTPREKQSLVSAMATTESSNTSLLDRWIDETSTPGIAACGPMPDEARQALFGTLVSGQDGTNLEHLFRAARSQTAPESIEQPAQDEFLDALAMHGTREQSAALAQRLLEAARSGDAQAARGVAELLAAAPDSAALQDLLDKMDRPTMDAVVASTAAPESYVTGNAFGGTTVDSSVDLGLYEQMAASVARSGNAVDKAAFAAATAPVFDRLKSSLDGEHQESAVASVAAALSLVIGSDVEGVIENTLLQNDSQGGSSGRDALKAYAGALLDGGQGAHLGAITLSLQRGNDLSQDPMARMSALEVRSGEEPAYANARLMGDWLGITASAIQSRISSRDQNAAYGVFLFSGGADVMKELAGNAFPALKLPSSLLTIATKTAVNGAVLSWRNALARTDREFSQSLYEAALPRHASGVEATGPWVTTMNAHFNASAQRQ
jgi:hypothetical protein